MLRTKFSEFRTKFSELSPRQQAALLTAISVQWSLAMTAWVDLLRRPTTQVNGSKAKWAAIIAVNWVGPIDYFLRGRRPPAE